MGFLQDIVADARPRGPAPAAVVAEAPEPRGFGAEAGAEAGAETEATAAAPLPGLPNPAIERPMTADDEIGDRPPGSAEPAAAAARPAVEPSARAEELALEAGTPEAIGSEPMAPPPATIDVEAGTPIGHQQSSGESTAASKELTATPGAAVEPSPPRHEAPTRSVPSPPPAAARRGGVSAPLEPSLPATATPALATGAISLPAAGGPADREPADREPADREPADREPAAAAGAAVPGARSVASPSPVPAPAVGASGRPAPAARVPAAEMAGEAGMDSRLFGIGPNERSTGTEAAAAASAAPAEASRQMPQTGEPTPDGERRAPRRPAVGPAESAAAPGAVTPARALRSDAKSRQPRVHIGQVEVIVTAPPATSGRARERRTPRSLASRHYLRTL